MSWPAFADVNFNRRISRRLRAEGLDVEPASFHAMERASDERLYRHAERLGRAVLTHDRDFLEIARRLTEGTGITVPIVWVDARVPVENAANAIFTVLAQSHPPGLYTVRLD